MSEKFKKATGTKLRNVRDELRKTKYKKGGTAFGKDEEIKDLAADSPYGLQRKTRIQRKKKGGKRKVTKGYLGDDWRSKRVEKTTKRGSTIKEKEDQYNEGYLGHKPKDIEYNNKKLWKRRFKSKKDKEGKEIKRKEKIVYDDGTQSKKRTQRKIRFGKNKGKIKSKTVHWNKGKKTVTKRILDTTDKSKLKSGGVKYKEGGFLEGPIPTLFED